MKCNACGENNVQAARFCAFCGVKLTETIPVSENTPPASENASRSTARPLSDNPYQPYRPSKYVKPIYPSASSQKVAPILAKPAADSVKPKEPFNVPSNSKRYLTEDSLYPETEQLDDTIDDVSFGEAPEAVPAEVLFPNLEPIDCDMGVTDMDEEAEDVIEEMTDDAGQNLSANEDTAPHFSGSFIDRGSDHSRTATPLHRRDENITDHSSEESDEEEHGSTRVKIKSSPKRVFVFSEEDEEDIQSRRTSRRSRYLAEDDEDEDEEYVEEYDGIREFDENNEFEEDEEDDGYEEDDEEPVAGRIFVRVFSVLTVLLLIVGLFAFAYGTNAGRRLQASMNISSSPQDYILLADWQLKQNNLSDASDSYYNAFKLDQDNYDFALTVGTGFENAQDDTRAEQLYSYLITRYPLKDEPYDRLMTLLNRQGRTAEYESLLHYRTLQQPDYQPPVSQISQVLQTPTSSASSGAYLYPFVLTLDAGGAEIRYTIDGTTPTAYSQLYTGAVHFPRGSYTVRAVAVVNGKISPEWRGDFFIS